MRKLLRPPLLVIVVALAMPAQALDLDALWDFGQPALSEQRFRDALAGASPDEQLILRTQIARTLGLRKDFEGARRELAAIEAPVAGASAEVQVRHALELGRSHASAAHDDAAIAPEHREAARRSFQRAAEIAQRARLDALAIDALHMMVFVDTAPAQQVQWNRRALAVMEASDQPRARRWEGALRNNLGYSLRLLGEYDAAIEQFRLSRAAYERAGRAGAVRVADWMIARVLREQGRLQQALAMQLELEKAWDAAGAPDPEVFEELVHLYRALGDADRAAHYTARLEAARP